MGCCTQEAGEIFKPRGQRGCTDLLCLLGFIAGMGGLVGLTVVSVNKQPGLLTDLVYPADAYGNNCGEPGTPTATMGKVIFPALDTDIIRQLPLLAAQQYWLFRPTKMCATACPAGFSLKTPVSYGGPTYPSPLNNTAGAVPSFWYLFDTQDVIGYCFPKDTSAARSSTALCSVPACSNVALNATLSGSVQCVNVPSQPDADNVWEVCGPGVSTALCAQQRSACEVEVSLDVTDSFRPTGQSSESEYYTQALASYTQSTIGAIESLLVTQGIVTVSVCGVLIPVLLGFAWAVFLYLFAGLFIWTLLIGEVVFMITLSAWLSLKAGWFDSLGIDTSAIGIGSLTNSSLTASAAEDEQTYFMVAAIIVIILTVLNILFVITTRRAIGRLIAIVRECTKVFKSMFLIVFWPLWGVALRFAAFLGGLVAFYFLFYVWQEQEEDWIYATILIAHVLGVLWLLELIRALNWSSMAGAVGYWFVTDNAPGGDSGCCPRMGGLGLLDSTWTMTSRHLGSLAFGALVIAVSRLLQMLLGLLDYLTKEQQKSNLTLKLLMKCTQCCVWCLRKTIEFISNKGFIFVAIEGTGFCRACSSTFGFIVKYPAQTMVNAIVQKLLKLIIGLTTPLVCALVAFFWLDNTQSYKAAGYNPLWAAIVSFLAAYIVADGVCIVFDVSIDTIYLCAFKDMEENNPPKFMSDELRSGFGLDKSSSKAALGSSFDDDEHEGRGTAKVRP